MAAGQAERWAVRVGWRHGCRAASTAERAGAPAVRLWGAPLAARAAGRADTPPPHDGDARNAAASPCWPWRRPSAGPAPPSCGGVGWCSVMPGDGPLLVEKMPARTAPMRHRHQKTWPWGSGLRKILHQHEGPNCSGPCLRTRYRRRLYPCPHQAWSCGQQYLRPAGGLWLRGAVHPVVQSSEAPAGRESLPVSPPPAAISAASVKGGCGETSERPGLQCVRFCKDWPVWACIFLYLSAAGFVSNMWLPRM